MSYEEWKAGKEVAEGNRWGITGNSSGNAQKSVDNSENDGKMNIGLQFFASKEKQFGKKVGKHASDFGLDPSSEKDRIAFQDIVDDIVDNASETRIGNWRGQEEDVIFHIKESDVVITKQSGEFITVLKGGIENGRVKNARKR